MRTPARSFLGLTSLVMAAGGVLAPPAAADDPVRVAEGDPQFSWQPLDSGATSTFASIDSVNGKVAWAGDLDGEIMLTRDGGASFTDVAPAEGDGGVLQFIDLEATSRVDALALAFATDDGSGHVFRTTDGGETWTETLTTELPSFPDCMAMFDRRHGFVMGDPVDGKFQIWFTEDAGRSWELRPSDGMPPALENEASGSFGGDCAEATGKTAFFGAAFNEAGARVFRSTDFGQTWDVSSLPPETGGVFGLAFRTNRLGLASGEARTTDGGVTWQPTNDPAPVTGQVAWWADARGDQRASSAARTVIGLGDDGSYVSRDRGKSWEKFSDLVYYVLDCAEDTRACWAAGPEGILAKLLTD